jgi:hypothetical protein
MSLKPCHECKTPVSSDAKNCPACGAKQRKPVGLVGWFFAILLGATVFQCTRTDSYSHPTTATPAVEQKPDKAVNIAVSLAQIILKEAKNPKSIEWVNVVYIQAGKDEGEGAYCFEIRGTNSFNAIVIEQTAFTITTKESKKAAWDKVCAGKNGRDLRAVVKYSL